MSNENLKEVEKLHFRPFTRFCMSIGAVPSSYLAGLTIEEQMLWLCSYLEKEVVGTVNNNAEAVTELQNLYIQLHDYVEHYFDNLDVQQEINKKLDEMAENGSLYEMFDRFITPTLEEQDARVNALIESQNIRINGFQNELESIASGSPLVASSTSGMTDTTRIYVNTTDGKWYYYDGDSWEIGGTYQSTMGAVDTTLTQSGSAPDSKIVGEKLQEKNFDIEKLSGYKIIQNPISYSVNSGSTVSGVTVTENTVAFTVTPGQTTKGVLSTTLPIIRGKTYTIKFTVSMSDTENAIKFYYNGGPGTLNTMVTGTKEITSTWTRAETYGADGALLFFIDSPAGNNSTTCTISNLILFEGSVDDIVTLKTLGDKYKEEETNAELREGIIFETTNSGTYTSNIDVIANKTYKIDVIEMTNNTNFFSSADTSTSVVRATTIGTYYFVPIANGKLSSFAFSAQNFHVKAKITIVDKDDVLYVSTSGSDLNSGLTPSNALATIQKAIEKGARNILVKRGTYHESIFLSGNGESISIKPYDTNTYTDSIPDRPLIEIINGTELTGLSTDSTYTNLLSQEFSGNSAWTAVFIDQTLPPSTSGYRGYNNAGLWQISGTTDYSKDKRVTPVLTLSECINTAGTFYWDGTTVYVNPYDEEYDTFYAQDAVDYGIRFENLEKVDLQDICVKFSKQANFGIKNCMDIHLQNCVSQYTNVINGFQLNNSNGLLENCQAYNSRDDGFGAQDYGVTTYINCIGNYNDDDGISHHFGERATIIGGEFAYNGKGGVASPTYGAYVNVYNVYTHHNSRGIYATNASDSHDYATRTCFVNNCLITNNTVGVDVGGTTTIIGWNNIFKDNTTKSYGNYVDVTSNQ